MLLPHCKQACTASCRLEMPLQAPSTAHDSGSESDEAETPEQVLMRRTREFNVALRESPHRLQLWLDYAEFQEEVVRWVP